MSLAEGLLLECVLTTTGTDGVNIAPMGPIVDETMSRVLLRPFRSSTTYRNLKGGGQAVLHVTDDVELIARAALDKLSASPPTKRAPGGGVILCGACRWYELKIESIDDQQQRTQIACQVVERGRLRDFIGFNRAMHAVIEATILATRLAFLPPSEVTDSLRRLAPLVEKTGGPRERRAFALVQQTVAEQMEQHATNG